MIQVPGISVVSQYFYERRTLAMATVASVRAFSTLGLYNLIIVILGIGTRRRVAVDHAQ